MKNVYENEKMSVETNELDVVTILNKVTDSVTSVQIVDEGFTMTYSEGDEDLQNIEILTGGEVNVSSISVSESEEEEAA